MRASGAAKHYAHSTGPPLLGTTRACGCRGPPSPHVRQKAEQHPSGLYHTDATTARGTLNLPPTPQHRGASGFMPQAGRPGGRQRRHMPRTGHGRRAGQRRRPGGGARRPKPSTPAAALGRWQARGDRWWDVTASPVTAALPAWRAIGGVASHTKQSCVGQIEHSVLEDRTARRRRPALQPPRQGC